jgi:methionyl-tRNA formyltransferase
VRLVFFGSPDFAVPSLKALVASGHEITLVVSQPARPVGRHGHLSDPPAARLAKSLSLPLFQPASLRPDEAVSRLAGGRADLFVVAAYGKILPQRVLDLPGLFAVNVHGSVLPRWRGASPVQAAILAGDATTGVSIMKMEAGMDTGPVFATEETAIGENENAAELGARLAEMGAGLLVRTLAAFPREATPQDDSRATYCPKITREDGLVDWRRPAAELVRRDRAFTPWPGLFTFRRKSRLKLSGLSLAQDQRPDAQPGTTLSLSPALVVACGEGAVAVAALQAEGRKRLSAADFVRGERVAPGEVWPS